MEAHSDDHETAQTRQETAHSVDDVFQKLEELKDLFLRRLLDDKAKVAVIGQLSKANDELAVLAEYKQLIAFIMEVFLVCDRIDAYSDCSAFDASVLEELLEILARRGITTITQLSVFDPLLHNAVRTVEASEDCQANAIAGVIRNGYVFDGKVIRPADVIVAKRLALPE